MSDIRPGLRVEFFYYADYEQEHIHVMRSIIYDVIGKKLILAQSSPTILRSAIKKDIVVTYLIRKDGKPTRQGVNAKIIDLVNDYQIASGENVFAVIVEQQGAPKPFDIRFNYRASVPSSYDLTLRISGERSALIDISIGGALISGPTVKGLKPNEQVKTRISFEDHSYELEAQVLRIWSPSPEGSRQDVQFAALKFVNPSRLFESALAKTILKIQREQIASEM